MKINILECALHYSKMINRKKSFFFLLFFAAVVVEVERRMKNVVD